MTTLESKIRISAVVTDAIGALRSLKAELNKLNDAAGASAETKGALDGLKAGAEEAGKAGVKAQRAVKDTGEQTEKSLKAAANQARLLAPQITDIVTGLATGQAPLTVLLQQGGQLRDVFGGFGNALRALRSIITPTTLALGGVGAILGIVAGFALAARREQEELNKTFALTGNIAGITGRELSALARQIAVEQKSAVGDVRETLAALVAGGNLTTGAVLSTGRAVTALRKITGASAEEAIKQFDGQAKGVAAWAAKANESFNFLTAKQFEYIRTLEAQGRTQEAVRFANDELSATLVQRHAPSVTRVTELWQKFGNELSNVFGWIKKLVSPDTPEDRLIALQEELKRVQAAIIQIEANPIGVGALLRQHKAREIEIQAEIADRQRQANATRLLAAERSAYLLAQQEEIRQKSKQYQDLLAQIDLAGSQKRLAGLLAGLDAERTAVELAHAKGETSALGHALALNTIDQNRLAAQKAVLERQLALLRARTDGTPDDIKAREAQVTQLEAQLVDVRSRIEQEAGKAVTIAASDALAKSQETAAEWVQTWQRSFSLIRDLARQNAAALATSIDDPFQRAEAEAKVRTAAAREQLDAQQADLQRQIDSLAGKAAQGLIIEPGMRDELLRQMKDLAARGAQAIEEQARSARFDSFRQQFAELAEALSLQEQSLAAQVEAGALSTEEAEQRKFAARAKALPQLEIYRKALDALAKSPAERNQVAQIVAETEKLKQKVSELQRVISSSFEGSVKGLFVDLATGAKTALEAFRDFVAGIARLALDLIAQAFAKRIAKSIFGDGGNAGTGEGGTAGSAIGAAIVSFFAGMFHRGGIVGEGSSSGSRAVSPAAFAWAPRYHSSGIVGLKPRERAIIAEDGEEVLDEGNPRHIRNFRGSGIGDVTINTVVQGAQGSTSDLRGAGDDLARVINSAIEGWASRESRQGGKLAIRGA